MNIYLYNDSLRERDIDFTNGGKYYHQLLIRFYEWFYPEYTI